MPYNNCPSCGLIVQPDWAICKFCRFDLAAHRAQASSPPPPPPPQYPQYQPYVTWPAPAQAPRPQPTRNSAARVVVAIVVILALAGAGLAVRSMVSSSGPGHPDEWDARVADIAAFVEDHRGHPFKHPVYVDFLTADEYSEATRTDSSELTDDDRAQLDTSVKELRALGLAAGDLDLLDASNELADSGTLAYYDPLPERVKVRGTDMSVDLRVTLVHELTHALQDQYFNIDFTDDRTSGESSAYRALVEGDAMRIEGEYFRDMSQEDQDTYLASNDAQMDELDTNLADVPVALHALQNAPYMLGVRFVELVAATGDNDAVDEAFRDPPTTDEQLLDPNSYFHRDLAATVDDPALPEGVTETLESGDFGALGLYLVLAERTDPVKALEAVDGWGGDAYVAYEKDGTTCMRLAIEADDERSAERLSAALDDWVAAMPAGSASVTPLGDTRLLLESCDPGSGSGLTLNNRAMDALAIPRLRDEIALQGVQYQHESFDTSYDFASCLVNRLTYDQLLALDANAGAESLPDDLNAALETFAIACS